MKKIAFLFAFMAFFAESSAKSIKVFFKEAEAPQEVLEIHEYIGPATLNTFTLTVKTELSNSLILVQDPKEAQYEVTARLVNAAGGRIEMMLEAVSGKIIIKPDNRISEAGDAEATKSFNERIKAGTKSMCQKILAHEGRHDDKLRAFVPGLAQFHKGYPVFGTTIIVTEVGTLLAGGIFAAKAKSNNDEAEVSRKKADNSTNVDDFNRYMNDVEGFDNEFKKNRNLAIGAFSTAIAIYVLNVITGFVLPYSNTDVAFVPVVSPNDQVVALVWKMNF
jgi:hypothetical protein